MSTPHPVKRARFDSSSSATSAQHLQRPLRPIPTPHLLLALPTLLFHPPNHPLHLHSLALSLFALRQCLSQDALDPDVKCRAWCALAEVGMMVVKAKAGMTKGPEGWEWAEGVENEVEQAISKGLILAQKHPILRAYKCHLTILHAKHANSINGNPKFARSLLKRLTASMLPNDPPHMVYTAHLALINLMISPADTVSPQPPKVTPFPKATHPDHPAALAALHVLRNLALKNAHLQVVLLTHVLELYIFVSTGIWDQVSQALRKAEEVLGLSYIPSEKSRSKPRIPPGVTPASSYASFATEASNSITDPGSMPGPQATFLTFADPFEYSMAIHTLIFGVVWYTYAGIATEADPRLSHLHALLDEDDPTRRNKAGVIEIRFPNSQPLLLQTTHPRVLYLFGFLVSCTAKRDPVGRKPKRKVFAVQGLAVWEKEVAKEIILPDGSSLEELRAVQETMARIKADLLSELIGVSILRSEFDVAEENLAILIAHTRNTSLFTAYSARITLHHAHLAHALGKVDRAAQCYRVAADLAREGGAEKNGDSWVEIAAKAGGTALEIGRNCGAGEKEVEEMRKRGMEVVKACSGKGGTLECVGTIIEACLLDEILRAKQRLKVALDLASSSRDNYLRALIMALVLSHFFHTDGAHAMNMLTTCEQLCVGLSGGSIKDGAEVGNAPLRLWLGERFLELYKRAGKEGRAEKQAVTNAGFQQALQTLALRR